MITDHFVSPIILFCMTQIILQDNDPTLRSRTNKSDAREMQKFYQHYYKKYIQTLQGPDKADRYRFSFSLSEAFYDSIV